MIDINNSNEIWDAHDDFKWVKTSIACPEQYDIYYKDVRLAYFRLRHNWMEVNLYYGDDDLNVDFNLCIFSTDYGKDGDVMVGEFYNEDDRYKYQHYIERLLMAYLVSSKYIYEKLNQINYYDEKDFI